MSENLKKRYLRFMLQMISSTTSLGTVIHSESSGVSTGIAKLTETY